MTEIVHCLIEVSQMFHHSIMFNTGGSYTEIILPKKSPEKP